MLLDPDYCLNLIEAFAFGMMLVLPVLDELVGARPQHTAVWGLRYVILLSGIWWFGASLEPFLASALLLVALLPLAIVHGSKLIPVGFGLLVLAVLLHPPLNEVASKGLSLLYIAVAAVIAVAISEILRGSSIQQQLERTVMMYRGILEQINDGVVLVDLKGRIELANRGFECLLGAEPGGLRGHSINELLTTEDDRPLDLSAITPDGRKVELMLDNPQTGKRCVALVSAHLIHRISLPDYLQLIVTDISEYRRMEQELERANERSQRLPANHKPTGN